jgi:hypothetical protein
VSTAVTTSGRATRLRAERASVVTIDFRRPDRARLNRDRTGCPIGGAPQRGFERSAFGSKCVVVSFAVATNAKPDAGSWMPGDHFLIAGGALLGVGGATVGMLVADWSRASLIGFLLGAIPLLLGGAMISWGLHRRERPVEHDL